MGILWLLFVWFSYIIFFHQIERVAIILWVFTCIFLFTHFNIKISIIFTVAVIYYFILILHQKQYFYQSQNLFNQTN